MKVKKIFLAMILCCVSVFAAFGFAGCGDVSLATIEENFNKLDATFASYSDVFTKKEGKNGSYSIYIVKSYGEVVDGFIKQGQEQFVELENLYNRSLEIASDYVGSNRAYVLLPDKEINDASKNILKDLNASLENYTNSLSGFVKERENLIEHFSVPDFQNTASDAAMLLRFKKSYGQMVGACVTLSVHTAKFVESTEIFRILRDTEPTTADTSTLKEYVRAKLLPIFTEFKITEIANEMNWNAMKTGDVKERIDDLLEKLDAQFAVYRTKFLEREIKAVALSSQELNQVFDWTEEFFVEAESFYQALYGLDLYSLAVGHGNSMEKYLKTNELAEIYLQKLEQFVGITLPNFMDAVSEKLIQEN